MSLQFKIDDSKLICDGDGILFLKLKASLADYLGRGQVRTLSAKSFSLPLISAVAASSVFKETQGSVPDELASYVELWDKHGLARNEAMGGVLEEQILPLESPWMDVLDPAQAIAVSAMVTPHLFGLCLFDEQGVGKTVTTIAAFDVLQQRKEADCLVIVCPLTMTGGWEKEIERFIPKKYRITLLEGTSEQRRQQLQKPFDVLICNFESIPPLLTLLKGILGNKKAVLAVDESFNVKNKEAVRSTAIRELRDYCTRGFVMCGTPAPNSPVDVINQFDIADGGYTFAGFIPSKDEKQHVEEINERMSERGTYVRRLKEDVLPGLPDKNFHVIPVVMSGRQLALYEEARAKLELSLRSMDNSTFKKSLATYFQQRSALLQICACPEAIDPSFPDASAKLIALDHLVDEIVEKAGKKLLIWSFYRASLHDVYRRYSKYSPILLDGSSSAKQRASDVQRFQTDPSVRICVANPAAAGAGVTLHSASDATYLSFSNQAAHFLQSIDRIHRRGQTAASTDYHLIVCKDTIEETEVQRLRAKEVRQNELLGDNVKWPNSLDEALSELTK